MAGTSGRGGPKPWLGPPVGAALSRRLGPPVGAALSRRLGPPVGAVRSAKGWGLRPGRPLGRGCFGQRVGPTGSPRASLGPPAGSASFAGSATTYAPSWSSLGRLRRRPVTVPTGSLGPPAEVSGADLTTYPPAGPRWDVRSSGGPLLRRGVYAVGPRTRRVRTVLRRAPPSEGRLRRRP